MSMHIYRKIRFTDTGEESGAVVPYPTRFGDLVSKDGREAVCIDPDAPGGREGKRGIGFPAIGGRIYQNGGYRSEAWGTNADKASIEQARAVYDKWDYDETGAAIIHSEREMREGAAAHKAHMDSQALTPEQAASQYTE